MRTRFVVVMLGFGLLAIGGIVLAVRLTAPPPPFDEAFIDFIAPHHQTVIAMAELAEARASHPELRAFAQTLIRFHMLEVNDLRTWRALWYGNSETPPVGVVPMLPAMDGPPLNLVGDLDALRRADERFDRAALDSLMARYRTAIEAGSLAETTGAHLEIRYFGRTIADGGARELAQLQDWRQQWYGE